MTVNKIMIVTSDGTGRKERKGMKERKKERKKEERKEGKEEKVRDRIGSEGKGRRERENS